MASPSTSYVIGNHYSQFEVFINHRGPDVKKGLASHLYYSLSRHGLRVFLDAEELQGGDNLTAQIEGAIRTASVHIAILSPRYAESSWCLNELVQMLESGKTIIPVFYNVNPSELRWTCSGDGVYAQALHNLEKKRTFDSQPRYAPGIIEKWRQVLSVVAEISGFELKACDGDEGLLVQKIVEQVFRKVAKTPLNVAKYPTGLDDKVKDFERTMLSWQQSEKIIVVGIVGLGGVGKTTLAKEFFNRHRSNYGRSCFLCDVRENGAKNSLHSLQMILLTELGYPVVQINNPDEGVGKIKEHLSSRKDPRLSSSKTKTLVVLDNVDHSDQLDALFSPVKDSVSPGSLILVTSRNKDILTRSGIESSSIYKLTGLNRQHSQELFCCHAFNQRYPVIGFERLVDKFLDGCDGLPLSLKVIGAILCAKDLKYWEAQLHKLSRTLPSDILSRLRISYDSLDEEEKQIFLDIACFFIGEDWETAVRIWDASLWQGWLGFTNLKNKCLVGVDSENCITMHDHLRDLGRDIAKKETPHRLWRSDNILSDHLTVRGISMVHGTDPQQSFEIPTNLRGLQLLRGQGTSVKRIFSVPQPPHPVWLRWDSCPYASLPCWISVKNLRVLNIQGGILETLWQDQSQAPLQLRELIIDANLLNFPKSVGTLKHLEKFVLRCRRGEKPVYLKTLPDEVCGMTSLKHLELVSCKNITSLPNSAGNWMNLQHIYLRGCTALQGLPDSAGSWTNLQSIQLHGCSALQGLPDLAGNWTNLQDILLSRCPVLKGLPDSTGNWKNLRRIYLDGCSTMQGLPDSAGNWKNLHCINLSGCSALQGLPDSAGNWKNLQCIYLSGCSAFQGLPDSAGNWKNLQHIYLNGCSSIQGLQVSAGNWTNLSHIYFNWCSALQRLPDSAGNWTNLRQIELSGCYALQGLPDSAGNWTNLTHIDLSGCSALEGLPYSAGKWKNLRVIYLGGCSALEGLPDSAGKWTNLVLIFLKGCSLLQGLPGLAGNWTNLKHIDLSGCFALQELQYSAGNWTNLSHIDLSCCSALQGLPYSAGNWANLRKIDLRACSALQRLPDSAGNWANLRHIDLSACSALQRLPDSAGNWANLRHIDLTACSALQRLPDSAGKWTNLRHIYLGKCFALQELPDSAGNWTDLRDIHLDECSAMERLPDSAGNWTNLERISLKACPVSRYIRDPSESGIITIKRGGFNTILINKFS